MRSTQPPTVHPLLLELVYTAWDMSPFARSLGYNGPPFRWDDERRPRLRAELDALMLHLYGLNRENTACIMDTFPIVKRKDEQEHGEYRTKRLILQRYDAMAAAFEAAHSVDILTDTLNGMGRSTTLLSDRQALTTYSHRLAEALAEHYITNINPPPAHPTQAHLSSTYSA